MKKYNIIYADPPWSYRDTNSNGERGAKFKYLTLSIEDIQALPVQNISKENSVLFLWCTSPLMEEGIQTLKAWGFDYKTFAFVWVKQNRDGGIFRGLGHYTRSNAEYVLIGKRGKTLERDNKGIHQVLMRTRTKHSQKPVRIQQRIDSLYSSKKYNRIELFARRHNQDPSTSHWDRTGLEFDGIPIQTFLKEQKDFSYE